MSDFEEKLNSILSNPSEMEKITRLASQLMGGQPPEGNPGASAFTEGASSSPKSAAASAEGVFPDPELIRRLGKIMDSSQNDKTALLRAMSPYMAPERRAKLEKAIGFARLAKAAGAVFGESGFGKGDGKGV